MDVLGSGQGNLSNNHQTFKSTGLERQAPLSPTLLLLIAGFAFVLIVRHVGQRKSSSQLLEKGVVPVPVEPSWLPYLGHPLNLVWNANSYLNRLRSKYSGGIFSLNLLGTRHHILHTPGLTHTFFAQDEKANVNDVAEHIGIVVFGFPKDEGKKFQEAAGELHALGKYLVNEEFLGVMVERTTRRAEDYLADFVTGREDVAEQKPWERRSRVKKTTNSQGRAARDRIVERLLQFETAMEKRRNGEDPGPDWPCLQDVGHYVQERQNVYEKYGWSLRARAAYEYSLNWAANANSNGLTFWMLNRI
ncbi:hypothetical protein HII31_10183 [Pseudocercospora fuligena]|uniref:Cytochrome P450 n=1 Tax=Pseudocercospora fuligena TaxID=685502 RepID=A0A8H6R9K5_9PEZI|nr:hypothetical protein HII31_10183 [Pseudocercospora fuligena]